MASAYLHRTNGTATNSQKMTFSTWFKIGTGAAQKSLFGSVTGSGPYTQVKIMQLATHNNVFRFEASSIEGNAIDLKTNRVFRDPAAWYHLVVAIDTTQAGSSDRAKIYINGVQETSFATSTYPTQNDTLDFSASGVVAQVMAYNNTEHWDGSFAHTHFIDGLQYAASIFGETDSTSGIWIAKTSPSVTYGNNGFFLKYASGAITTDSSGNGNTMTQVGTMTTTKDSPDNNFCTMNPLEKNTNNTQAFSNGNNTAVITAGYAPVGSTMSVSKGKWYVECHIDSTASSGDLNIMLGINGSYNDHGNNTLGYSASAYGYYLYNGYMLNNNTGNSNTGGTQYVTSPGGGIVDDNKYWALALDCDNNKLYVRLDGTWLQSANPSSGTGGYSITAPASTDWGCYRFANGVYFGNTNTFKWNFGNGFFGTTSAGATNADSDGYGVFKYSVPTGFKALCTAQLATYG